MQRLFTSFPSGSPGIGLLLIRIVLSLDLLHLGPAIAFVRNPSAAADIITLVVTATALISGVLLALGCLTPLAALLSVGAQIADVVLRAGIGSTTISWQSWLVELGATGGLLLMGPGAYSFDARMFGRREIAIPSMTLRSDE